MENGKITGAVVTFVDISARKALEAEQKRMLAEAIDRADRDPLTGLLNHRAFQKRLEEEADRALRGGSLLAIALLDIDNFKFFNDVYGHKVGDAVLQQVAGALRSCSRSYDSLSRFGGDEFALLMPCKGDEQASDLIAQLRERLSGVSYRPDGYDQSIPLGLSVGLALFPLESATRVEALEMADERLRRSKTGGDEDGYAETVRATLNHSCEGFSMLDALVTAVDNKDRYTRRHSEDVMRYCSEIAKEMGLEIKTQRLLETAALIHDVGKIGVPDHILRKPGQLNDEEFAAIRQHPVMGAVIAEAVPGFEETLNAIRHHHERWDGMGYPFGLKGKDTPFEARLMAVADAFSAMTTDRPYRKGMPHQKALTILSEGAGVQWDPECVAAFLRARRAAAQPLGVK
jgi:diguanylate cyclase (GGDEF)-like protein/putative nucleotidyltransferase with HDIG domain